MLKLGRGHPAEKCVRTAGHKKAPVSSTSANRRLRRRPFRRSHFPFAREEGRYYYN